MLSIDEAIAHAREVANSNKTKATYDDEFLKRFCTSKEACIKCAEEHEQLADWLEELKALKNGLNIKCDNLNEALEKGKKIGYNKALDDFVNACKEDISCQTFGLHINGIERIAEQLKEMEDK